MIFKGDLVHKHQCVSCALRAGIRGRHQWSKASFSSVWETFVHKLLKEIGHVRPRSPQNVV